MTEADAESGPARPAGGLLERLAGTNLLFLLPVAFFVAAVLVWQWANAREVERVRRLTSQEASRVAAEIAERLQGHADVSLRSSEHWLLRGPRDQGEWDYELFARRWLHPELETIEWLNGDLTTRWRPARQDPVVGQVAPQEELQRAIDEHRVVVAGPVQFPDGDPVSLTIVPIERPGSGDAWVVSAYDLGRVLGFRVRGASPAFGLAMLVDGREIWATEGGAPEQPPETVRTIELNYDRFSVELMVWPRVELMEPFGTELPRAALIAGVLATIISALGIRLAQVSSRRAIEARMTRQLQREVSARKRAEKSLERRLRELSRSNEEFERFAYAIAHDLRDPLNAVHLNVQAALLAGEDDLPAESRSSLERSAAAVGNLDVMVGHLLEYARAGSGTGGMELTDAAQALEGAADNLRGLIEQHGAAVGHGALPQVIAPRGALTRVFQNLISNAIKYRAERSPRVNVEAVRGEDEWVFSVADNARGMDDEEVARAFGLFWRRDDADDDGSGIGLAVCQRIVERHGGRMWVESRPGEGSTFFFTWPTDPAGGSGPSAPRKAGNNDR